MGSRLKLSLKIYSLIVAFFSFKILVKLLLFVIFFEFALFFHFLPKKSPSWENLPPKEKLVGGEGGWGV